MAKEFLNALEAEIGQQDMGKNPIELYEPIQYLMSLGGKRIRPVLCLLTYSLFKDQWQKAISPSLSLEIFHNFTLMHDDIMDKAPLRRGKQTVHEKWNDNIAILSGDVMLVNAYQYLNKIKDLSLSEFQFALERFNKTAAEVCEGQQMDMNFESRSQVQIAEYVEMIRLKTSVLIGLSLEMGAILGGASVSNCQHLYEFGKNIGIAFQLQDDYLDAFGDAALFGKEPGGDIKQNKKTFLLIHALEVANAAQKKELNELLSSNAPDKVEKVLAIFKSCGVDAWAEASKAKYMQEAFAHLESIALVSDRKKPLIELANYLMNRNQ